MVKSIHVTKAILFLALTLTVCSARYCSSKGRDDGICQLASANNDLALKLYRSLSQESTENVFFSPFSISCVLGMLLYGAEGETAKELGKTLGYSQENLKTEQVHDSFHKFLTDFMPGQSSKGYVLDSANAILVAQKVELTKKFEQNLPRMYDANIQKVDFGRPDTVDEINNWVRNKTHGKIDGLLEKVDSSTLIMLLNAVYFKAAWKTQFQMENTRPQVFYNGGLESGAKEIPMMSVSENFLYSSFPDAEALELPYEGGNISLLILLPKKRDGLRRLEDRLSLENLSAIREQLSKTKILVNLPKFKVQFYQEMLSPLKAIGVRKIFSSEAEFSEMSTDKIFVSQLLHKAVLNVNEEGSEAAAITAAIAYRKGNDVPNFFVDHPFIFAICDTRADMILFMGRVNTL